MFDSLLKQLILKVYIAHVYVPVSLCTEFRSNVAYKKSDGNVYLFQILLYSTTEERRPQEETWVFGIVTTEYTRSRGYFEVVYRRNREIHTDDWGAYRGLEQGVPNDQRHRVVVHADQFIDPATGVHTQNIESAWAKLNLGVKIRKGIRRCDLQAYLDNRMWRQWRGGQRDEIVVNFLPVLARQYSNFAT